MDCVANTFSSAFTSFILFIYSIFSVSTLFYIFKLFFSSSTLSKAFDFIFNFSVHVCSFIWKNSFSFSICLNRLLFTFSNTFILFLNYKISFKVSSDFSLLPSLFLSSTSIFNILNLSSMYFFSLSFEFFSPSTAIKDSLKSFVCCVSNLYLFETSDSLTSYSNINFSDSSDSSLTLFLKDSICSSFLLISLWRWEMFLS